MTDDLIARLRESDPNWTVPKLRNPDGPEAADWLEVLRKHADAMAEALHQCTAVLTANDCASVSKVLIAYRTAFPEPRHD